MSQPGNQLLRSCDHEVLKRGELHWRRYITDTANSGIYKLPASASTAEPFLEHRALDGIDGITFRNSTLYVNKVFLNNLYRIPVDAAGKAGEPVDIWMDQSIKAPDGMRSANDKLIVADNASGRISVSTVYGDKVGVTVIIVTVIIEGLNTPIGVELGGDIIWISEYGAGKVHSLPMPK
jgi:hypothetical protein